MNQIIYASNLVKVYGMNKQVKALNNVSLSINEGDFICIMGPSGSGKSTFLNILATIDFPTEGYVKLFDKNTKKIYDTDLARLRYENIGFIFQDFNLIDSLTVRENIGVPLTLAEKNKDEINEKVNKLAKRLGIDDVLDKFPVECSGGQRQRTAVGRALVTEPKIIFADEPTGNLDTENSHEVLKIIKEQNRDGKTVVMVTHDSLIASYSKKVIIIKDGQISNILSKEGKKQKEFYFDIVNTTSKDGQNLFELMDNEI